MKKERRICYSKEVSLVAGATIIVTGSINLIQSRLGQFADARFQKSFSYFVTGYLCIGFHQLFEFWAILAGYALVYKTGLMCSISAMYFNLKGTEQFFGLGKWSKYWVPIFALMMLLLGVDMFSREMIFENAHFYVRGESHFLWGGLWMILFVFWNAIHFWNAQRIDFPYRRTTVAMTFYVLNFSFIMAAVYCVGFGLYQNMVGHERVTPLCGGLISNFEIVFDAPSIWCVFAAVQGFFLFRLRQRLQTVEPFDVSDQFQWKIPLGLSIVVWLLMFLCLPILSALGYKMLVK